MLALASAIVGLVLIAGGTLWLLYILARPKKWARFTEKENAFWVRRGFPTKWAGQVKASEQAWPMKALLACCIFLGVALIAALFLPHHHG